MTTVRTTVLTSRGRGLLRLASYASILVLAFALFGAKAQGATSATNTISSTQASHLDHYQQITVAPGETLWELASMVRASTGSHGDIRDLVDQITSLNGLESPAILAGSRLFIPLPK
jgi:hypothetical protein